MTATSLKGIRATEAATVAKSKPKPDADRAGFEATLVYSVIAV
jgi:hypothetical protein